MGNDGVTGDLSDAEVGREGTPVGEDGCLAVVESLVVEVRRSPVSEDDPEGRLPKPTSDSRGTGSRRVFCCPTLPIDGRWST